MHATEVLNASLSDYFASQASWHGLGVGHGSDAGYDRVSTEL